MSGVVIIDMSEHEEVKVIEREGWWRSRGEAEDREKRDGEYMGLAERSKKTVTDTMGWEEEEKGMKKESKSRNENKHKDSNSYRD